MLPTTTIDFWLGTVVLLDMKVIGGSYENRGAAAIAVKPQRKRMNIQAR
jgi:hypothetical protein